MSGKAEQPTSHQLASVITSHLAPVIFRDSTTPKTRRIRNEKGQHKLRRAHNRNRYNPQRPLYRQSWRKLFSLFGGEWVREWRRAEFKASRWALAPGPRANIRGLPPTGSPKFAP